MQMPTQPDSEPSSPVRSHVCRGFRRRAGFTVPARDSLAAGERVRYVAPGDEASLTARLGADGRFADGFRRGAVRHRSLCDGADYGERHATTVVLRTRLSTPGRLLELFGLTGVRVERAA
ncbi:hypothetical protein [Amycolatopsis sp. NPDC051061]|uniref:hypothetical protein n=1 Tax=Amycolatopsis sp. NPDC051061 TaxID=3155042 RepID=UPI0034398AD1